MTQINTKPTNFSTKGKKMKGTPMKTLTFLIAISFSLCIFGCSPVIPLRKPIALPPAKVKPTVH
jgi:hypothetical protein